MNVAILGASPKEDRYSHQAQSRLMDAGYSVFPVSQDGRSILGVPGYASLDEIPDSDRPVHTVTVYLNPNRLRAIQDEVLRLAPQRIIFNPGTESAEAQSAFAEVGIHVVEACTLVLLQTGQFDDA